MPFPSSLPQKPGVSLPVKPSVSLPEKPPVSLPAKPPVSLPQKPQVCTNSINFLSSYIDPFKQVKRKRDPHNVPKDRMVEAVMDRLNRPLTEADRYAFSVIT
jgi:hypothetical protein